MNRRTSQSKQKKTNKQKQQQQQWQKIVLWEDMNLLAFKSLYSNKQAQKFHTDNSSLPRSG